MEDKKTAGIADQDLIDINDDLAFRGWADQLGVTYSKLKATVNTVGTSAKKVEVYLNKSK